MNVVNKILQDLFFVSVRSRIGSLQGLHFVKIVISTINLAFKSNLSNKVT